MPNLSKTHYCTITDRNYLPLAVTLALSMNEHSASHTLWIVCVDDWSYKCLHTIDESYNIKPVHLGELETEQLLSTKSSRKLNEYCWTVKPFLAQHLFNQLPGIPDLTYLDADLIFFQDPSFIFEDFRSNKNASIRLSHHNFSRRYRRGVKFGSVCGQMYSVKNTPEAHFFLNWWKHECIKRCDSDVTPTTFADQKYLDFIPGEIQPHVDYVRDKTVMTGPWNIEDITKTMPKDWFPVVYHAHGLRVYADGTVKCYSGYNLRSCQRIYDSYLTVLRKALTLLDSGAGPCLTDGAPHITIRETLYRLLGMAKWNSLQP